MGRDAARRPLSPLLANVLLDEVEHQELERRGLSIVRYADDLNVYVGPRRPGEDAMHTLRRLLAVVEAGIGVQLGGRIQASV